MKKKPPVIRFPEPKPVAQTDDRHWHNGGDIEIGFYARSLHKAAKTLIATLDLQPNPKTAWDACPIILLYRQAVELHLKALVDEGGNFLKDTTDSITLDKTHSLALAGANRLPDHQGGWMGERVQMRRCCQPCRLQRSGERTRSVGPCGGCGPILVTVVLMVGCRINYSRQTLCNSQRSWTAYWICWMDRRCAGGGMGSSVG